MMKHPKRDPRGKPSLPEAGTEQGWAGFTRTSKGCVSQAAARQERRAVLPHAARQGGCQPNKHFCLVLPPSPSLHCLNTSKGGQENQSVWSTEVRSPAPRREQQVDLKGQSDSPCALISESVSLAGNDIQNPALTLFLPHSFLIPATVSHLGN